MNETLLVKLLGSPATLIHGDAGVPDRWLWLRRRLPRTSNGDKAIDIGCGSGAFSIGAALRGYNVLGLSWSERNQVVASDRARMCKARSASFEVLDVRHLNRRHDLLSQYDVAICCETIEHIFDDKKLVCDIAACLRPGGRLLLTTPYHYYRPITAGDQGPFSTVEDGGHVRRGYSAVMLEELCDLAGLVVEEISYCTGVVSQRLIRLQRQLSTVHPLFAWAVVFPLRILPPVLDGLLTSLLRQPRFSICIEAYKPRYAVPIAKRS